MNRLTLPNFLGRRALIVHPASENTAVLMAQLERLGVMSDLKWPVEDLEIEDYNLVFFDADRGYDGQFSWEPGSAPVPLIALMGSEAPGRIEWTLSQMPSAYLLKPLRPSGIFSALTIAFYSFELHSKLLQKIDDLATRVKARPSVVTAINIVQSSLKVDSSEAYELLRSEAMKYRVSIEFLCEQISSAGSLAPLKKLAHYKVADNLSGDRRKTQNRNVDNGGQ